MKLKQKMIELEASAARLNLSHAEKELQLASERVRQCEDVRDYAQSLVLHWESQANPNSEQGKS